MILYSKFTWEWSNEPVLSGTAITDVVTCGFAGTNTSNLSCVVTATDVSRSVEYYQGSTKIGTKYPTASYKDVHSHVELKFKMSESFSNQIGWAKKGSFTVGAREEATVNSLYSVAFAFGYGHTVMVITPSISVSVGSGFSGGVGLSFGSGTENMFYKTLVVRRNGTTSLYNGS